MTRICRVTLGGDLNSTSGPSVALAIMTESLREDSCFQDLDMANNKSLNTDDLVWISIYWDRPKILSLIAEGRRFAIGPNVLFDYSQSPGLNDTERKIMEYDNYAAIFWQSRWYAELGRKNFRQKISHYVLSCPLPQSWINRPYSKIQDIDALIFSKGGDNELKIANQLALLFPNHKIISGNYKREELFEYASRSKVCFHISREDSYSIASAEINLAGCPILSDEKSSPVVRHGVTGFLVPVRERSEKEPFTWDLDSAYRLADLFDAATDLDRNIIRSATIQACSNESFRKTVKSILKL